MGPSTLALEIPKGNRISTWTTLGFPGLLQYARLPEDDNKSDECLLIEHFNRVPTRN